MLNKIRETWYDFRQLLQGNESQQTNQKEIYIHTQRKHTLLSEKCI